MRLVFSVYGVPQPKGSTKSFGYIPKDRLTGAPRMRRTKDGRLAPVILTNTASDNPGVKGWQQLVAEGASRALEQTPDAELLTDGVRLTIAFYLPRPKSLPKRVTAHLKKPDLDKLLRGVKDALTKVVWADDSQVVEVVMSKQYAPEAAYAVICVEPTAGCQPIIVPPAPLPLLEALL